MIRGKVIPCLLVALALAATAVHCGQFESLHLQSVERSISLAGAYPTESVRLSIHADSDEVSHFSFILPLDYDSKVSRIAFSKGKDKSALSFHRSVYIYVRSG
jgi:hypothetical protein